MCLLLIFVPPSLLLFVCFMIALVAHIICESRLSQLPSDVYLNRFDLPQWKYDQVTATYLLLLSKKQKGKPVRLRPEARLCEDSPLHQGLQVTCRTRPAMIFSEHHKVGYLV